MARPKSPPPPSFSPSEAADQEPWDAEAAARLVGKYVLIGVAWRRDGGETAAQYHGRIVSADPRTGFAVACEGVWTGETLVLPPMLSWLHPAQPGEYRLKTTGETVENPDLVTTWRISRDQATAGAVQS